MNQNRRNRVVFPRVITMAPVRAYTERELQLACRVALRLCCVLHLAPPYRP